MRYGSLEYRYAEPFATALVEDREFRSWVLQKTRFAPFANDARLLHEEMKSRRSATSGSWWRSHFTEKCRCAGCSGQKTDLLAIFEPPGGPRFALHFEVKQPADGFPTHRDQAANYALRAACWVSKAPNAVPTHSDAATGLLCSARNLVRYAPHLTKFGTVLTFEAIEAEFPHATLVEKS